LGDVFQFVTLAGVHSVGHSMVHLARGYAAGGMSAYVELQQAEFADEQYGYTAVKHQAEVGTGYFDAVSSAINPASGTLALAGSTEAAQF
jgi:isocitrate lyase